MTWKINLYQTKRGDHPIAKFISEQDLPTRTRLAQSIKLLADRGPFLKPPYIKKLQNKLYELRIQGENTIRIFYTIQNNEYYLLHVFKKKSQKTPRRELKTAIDRLKELI